MIRKAHSGQESVLCRVSGFGTRVHEGMCARQSDYALVPFGFGGNSSYVFLQLSFWIFVFKFSAIKRCLKNVFIKRKVFSHIELLHVSDSVMRQIWRDISPI